MSSSGGGLFGRPATRSRGAGRFLIFGILLRMGPHPAASSNRSPHHPVSEGSLAADPTKKMVPTTML